MLPLDFGLPGMCGPHSVGELETAYVRYFDCISPLGLNAGHSAHHGLDRGEHDSVAGTSCHYCRQKTDVLKVSCSACPVLFCPPCLLLRHGVAATAASPSWLCPKCLGTCTCSVCRRRAGLEPTGILGPAAVAAGFAGVEQYLAAQEGPKAEPRRRGGGERRTKRRHRA